MFQSAIRRALPAFFILAASGPAFASAPASGAGSDQTDQTAFVIPPGYVMHDPMLQPSPSGPIGAEQRLAFPNHPGWPVSVQGGASPPVCADFDPQAPGLEVAVGTLTSGPNLYIYHQDGTLVSGFPKNFGFWIAASPSVADLDGDGDPELVVCDFGTNRVFAIHADGTPLPGWPITVGANVRSTAALADLDPGTPGIEIIVGVQNGTVQAWHVDGTPVAGWPVTAGNFVERCSPAVGDVNGDGFLEVFVGSWYDYNQGSTGGVYGFDHTGAPLPGWPKLTATHTSVVASPVLADVDGDGSKEIVAATYETNAKVCVWRSDGTDVPGWPVTVPRGASSTSAMTSSPALGDIDGDGGLEIVNGTCGQCGTVYAWKRDGTVVPGWPFFTNAVVDGSSPALGDVDGDGQIEIVVGSGSGFTPYGCASGAISKAYVLRADGTVLPGWPLDLGTATPPYPAIADPDQDGNVEIVMAFSQTVFVWDAPGAFQASLVPWPYYHLGIDHTGDFGPGDPAGAEETTASIPRVFLRAAPNPWSGPGSMRVEGAPAGAVITICDPAGRVVRTLSGRAWDGRDAQGVPVHAGVYLLRSAGVGSKIVVAR